MADVVILEDREAWMAEAGSFTTIDFTGYPHGTIVTDQYEDLGITFGPFQMYVQQTSSAFPSDGFGLSGVGNSPIGFSFFEPQTWVGVDYPGAVQLELYSQGELIYQSGFYLPPGDSNFLGLLSPAPFDMVIVRNPTRGGQGNIDNLYFGSAGGGSDVNGDGVVDVLDLIAVLLAWGTDDSAADVNNDGVVDVADLIEVTSKWS